VRDFRRVAVYCGSSDTVDAQWFDLARAAGKHLAQTGVEVVYGGGNVGLMGALANGALDEGGVVRGVIPGKLQGRELEHADLTELIVVPSMSIRKNLMMHLADAFVALPGGFGTLEEIFEVATLTILGYHDKPVGLLNANGYYDGLLKFIRHASQTGFIRPSQVNAIQWAPTFPALMEMLRATPAGGYPTS
jgi:uncharacterized protein (TIGR00730 family)